MYIHQICDIYNDIIQLSAHYLIFKKKNLENDHFLSNFSSLEIKLKNLQTIFITNFMYPRVNE